MINYQPSIFETLTCQRYLPNASLSVSLSRLSGIHGIFHESHVIFSAYTRAFRCACQWQVGYSMVYHSKAFHNYFTPRHR